MNKVAHYNGFVGRCQQYGLTKAAADMLYKAADGRSFTDRLKDGFRGVRDKLNRYVQPFAKNNVASTENNVGRQKWEDTSREYTRSPNDDVTTPIVRHFYDNYAKEVKREHGGHPWMDYDPRAYDTAFTEVPRTYSDTMTPGFMAETHVNPQNLQPKEILFDSTMFSPGGVGPTNQAQKDLQDRLNVHETNHYIQFKAPFQLDFSRTGLTEKELKKLQAAYDFTGDDMPLMYGGMLAPNEMHSTNGEMQMGIYQNLSRQLGRPATKAEMDAHIKGMTHDDIYGTIQNYGVNGYIQNALKRRPLRTQGKYDTERLEAFRRAWLEVAKNKRRMPMPTGYNYRQYGVA